MPVIRIPILDFANPSGGTAGAVFAEPYSIKATNDVWNRLVWIFTNTATRDGLHSGLVVPRNYIGNPKIVVVWTSTVTTNDVVWDFDYRTVSGDDANSLDQTSNEESVTVTDTAPGAAHRRLEASMTLTAGNFAPDDEVEFALFRDGAAAGDTLAGDAIVFELLFEYQDTP